ncbi:MAG TPA: hypothetical protein VGR28_03060 [Candidatus Thermoplasmatota archaeon]|jgi:DNA-binding transcriptional ArsR family regulator|nr:hypothetical protein [Candidatus Thermoplasmatota archaeon]
MDRTVRPWFALAAIAFAFLVGATVAQSARALALDAAGAHAEIATGDLAVPELPADASELPAGTPVDLDSIAPITTDPLGRPLTTSAVSLPPVGAGPGIVRAQAAGPADDAASAAPAPAQAAEVAAASAVAAAGAMALKLEPVRRALFLLALPLYSRLKRHELLENGVRERIFRSVEATPGLSIIQVCRAGKVGWGTAVYHLQRLERDRMIVSRRDGQYRRFFLNGQAPSADAAPEARTMKHALAQRIAAFVQANPGCAQKDVCAALGIAPPLASKWLGRLLEAGLITSQREWKLVRYAPTPRLVEVLAVPAQASLEVAAPA